MTAKDFFAEAEARFKADNTKEVKVTYQFDISGPDGGTWNIKVDNGTMQKGEGPVEAPDVLFAAKDTDWVDIAMGKVNEQMAFMTGKLKVKGNMGQAMKLKAYFRMGA